MDARAAGPLIFGAGAGVVALWLLPEWWGSGDLLRAAHRAKNVNPGAPTYADSPARAVLDDASEMLTGPLMAGLVAGGRMVIARRDLRSRCSPAWRSAGWGSSPT